MIIKFSKGFLKEYKKLLQKIQFRVSQRIELFLKDQNHPLLNNHKLKGEYTGCSSINISGDVRAIYKYYPKENKVLFIAIGTQSQLY